MDVKAPIPDSSARNGVLSKGVISALYRPKHPWELFWNSPKDILPGNTFNTMSMWVCFINILARKYIGMNVWVLNNRKSDEQTVTKEKEKPRSLLRIGKVRRNAPHQLIGVECEDKTIKSNLSSDSTSTTTWVNCYCLEWIFRIIIF